MTDNKKTFNLVLTSHLYHLDYRIKQEIINLKHAGVNFEVIRKASRYDGTQITTVVLSTNNLADCTLLKLFTINNKILKLA